MSRFGRLLSARSLKLSLAVAALALLVSAPLSARRTPPPSVTVTGPVSMGFLPGGTRLNLRAATPSGYVSGYGDVPGSNYDHPFVWHPTTGFVDMGLVPGDGYVELSGLSNSGAVSGTAYFPGVTEQQYLAFHWTRESGYFLIVAPPEPINGSVQPGDNTRTFGRVTNSSGLVAVEVQAHRPSTNEYSAVAPYIWSRADGLVRVLPEGTEGAIYDINEQGQAVGYFRTGTEPAQAFVWSRATGMTPIGGTDTIESSAYLISETGEVTGPARDLAGNAMLFSWTPAGGLVNLHALAPTTYLIGPFAINAQGRIAGMGSIANGDYHAFLTPSSPNPVQDLGTLGGRYSYVASMNGSGLTMGTSAVNSFFDIHGFVAGADGVMLDLGPASNAIGISNAGLAVFQVGSEGKVWTVTADVTAPDTEAPSISLASPVDGATYAVGQSVAANFSCSDSGGSGLVTCAAPVANGALIDTSTPGPHTFTVTATDRWDNITTQTIRYTVPDAVAPVVTIESPANGVTITSNLYAPLVFMCDDAGGLTTCAAVDEAGQPIRNGDALSTALGQHQIIVTGTDHAGNTTVTTSTYTIIPDLAGPAISITQPLNGATFMVGEQSAVIFGCDDPAGVNECGPAVIGTQTYSLYQTIPTKAPGTYTITVPAVDALGNASSATATYTVLPYPSATIASPVEMPAYTQGQVVNASYTCQAVLGLATCDGTVANGGVIDTSTPGDFEFVVTVADNAGHYAETRVRYAVLAADVPPVGLPSPLPGGFSGPTSIGSLGGSNTTATAISRNGIVVGQSYTAGDTGYHAFRWTQANGMKDLGNFGPIAVSVNATVIGNRYLPGQGSPFSYISPTRAVIWTPSTAAHDLANPTFEIDGPVLPDDVTGATEAVAVNATGVVAGTLKAWRVVGSIAGFPLYEEHRRLAIWKPEGDVIVLPNLGRWMTVIGLTDAGVLVGTVEDQTLGETRTFTWTEASGVAYLPSLGGSLVATSVSFNGFVAGRATTAEGATHAFRWSATTGMIDLGETSYGEPSAVSSTGQVAGRWDFDGLTAGFTWTPETGTVALPFAGSPNSSVGSINASGQMTGNAYTEGFAEYHTLAWTLGGAVTDLGESGQAIGVSDNHLIVVNDDNQALVWSIPGFASDNTAAAITISAPIDGGTIAQNASVNAAFTCSDAQGVASCAGSVANGAPLDTHTVGTFSFTVYAVDNSGNTSTKTVYYTVSASTGGTTTPGHMHGDGYVTVAGDPNERQRFNFDVLARPTGQHHMRFNFWTADPDDTPRRTNVFDATSITSVTFSDDPAFTSGHAPNSATIDTVTFRGTGEFNGASGFTFEVTAADKGEPGANLDTFALVVKDGNGAIVFTAGGGAIVRGNVQSLRLPNRHYPPFLSGGPERVREVEAAGPNGTVVTFPLPTAVDENGNSLTVTCAPASGTTFPVGRTRGTCTATDASGRKGSMVFAVIVSDNTSPVFDAQPASITVEATAPNGADLTFAVPAATDLVDTSVTVNCNPDAGRRFHMGQTLVTCKARDNSGNTAVTTFMVTVRDTTAPVFAATPSSITAEATTPAGARVTFAKPTATDAADSSVSVVCTPGSNVIFARGTTTVTCTATDNSANTATTSFTVTVVDTVAPTITLSKPAQGAEYKLNQSVIANYACRDDGAGIASCIGTVADGAAINTSSLGTKTFTVVATDFAGNSVTRSVTYVVKPR